MDKTIGLLVEEAENGAAPSTPSAPATPTAADNDRAMAELTAMMRGIA